MHIMTSGRHRVSQIDGIVLNATHLQTMCDKQYALPAYPIRHHYIPMSIHADLPHLQML